MDTTTLLNQLSKQGLTVASIDGEKLAVTPASRLTDRTRAIIRQHKPEILAALTSKAKQTEPTFWRFKATRSDGSTAGFSFASGATLAEAREHASKYWPGSTVACMEQYPDPHHLDEQVDVEALAKEIARENGVTAEQVLSMLDADDRRDIENGDVGMADAWRNFIGLSVRRGWMRG
ncbi:MAG: hypothetical protein PHE55_22875 [Methylococcaceae bacterium]|nr:hypothetical protein [Methylococcaceae bacterium]